MTLGTFLAWFWNLLVLQRHGVFPPADDFFEAVLRQQPQATEAVEKGCFSRISEVTLGTFLAWFWDLLVLQRHGVFRPAGDFFEAVLRQQPQATEAVEKGCFSRISEVTLGTFFGVVLELARPSEARCFPPGRWFFRSCFTAAAAGNRSCRKRLFFQDFRSDVRHFFGLVLELARPSEARCFPPGRWFFRSCFTAAAAGNRSCRKRLFFQDFRSDVRHFFGVVLELARPSEARCFPPGRWFFSKLFYGSSRRQQKLSKKVVFPGFQTWR